MTTARITIAASTTSLLDYRSDQQHTEWHKVMLAHLQQHAWPVINTEFGYECGPKGVDDKTYNVAQVPEEVAVAHGRSTRPAASRPITTPTPHGMSFGHTIPRPDTNTSSTCAPSSESTSYWKMKPAEGIASDGYCLADAGREYVIFLNTAAPLTVALRDLTGSLTGEWYQPFSGARMAAGTIANGESHMIPPVHWGSGPVVLHVVGRQSI